MPGTAIVNTAPPSVLRATRARYGASVRPISVGRNRMRESNVACEGKSLIGEYGPTDATAVSAISMTATTPSLMARIRVRAIGCASRPPSVRSPYS
jgi:hypothetical protein